MIMLMNRHPPRTNNRAGRRAPSRMVPVTNVTLVIVGITSRPTFEPAPSDMVELTRDMRQLRTFPSSAAMYKYTARLTVHCALIGTAEADQRREDP
jgi:hypothetical protein